MWKNLLGTARFNDIRNLLSPKFFRVFPSSKIRSTLTELFGNYRDADRFQQVVEDRSELAAEHDIPIRIDLDRDPDPDGPHDHGRALLSLYFRQLFEPGPTILDLRRDRFEAEEEGLVWTPIALYIDWDEHFVEGVRDMYCGFYSDDDGLYQKGLERLDLQGIGDVLLEHFGDGGQRAVSFEMQHFYDSFDEVLMRCDEEGRSLHYQFAGLGIYLATLYDHLSEIGGTYDVRDIFESGGY